MSCPTTAPGPFRCPTLDESIEATLALLPAGRVWPAAERSTYARFSQWLAALTAPPAPAAWPIGFVQTGYFAAIGAVRNFVETRLCDLRLEFWCASASETRPEWMREYGLPDDCDPFPDLCTKVAAIGGARCEYFQAVTARAGWSIACFDLVIDCGDVVGCALAGDAEVGSARANQLEIDVTLADSPAYSGGQQTPSLSGLMLCGQPLACAPDIGPLQCLMDRIAPAHVTVTYKTL